MLSISGPAGVRHIGGRAVTVKANLRDAIRAGYRHPNCRHTETAYRPGMKPPVVGEQDPAEYEALQRQRAIERHIRRWKLREAVALTEQEKRYAHARVLSWQQEQRNHVSAHRFLARRYNREKLRHPTWRGAPDAAFEQGPAPKPIDGLSRKSSKRARKSALSGANPSKDSKNCVASCHAWAVRKLGYNEAAAPGVYSPSERMPGVRSTAEQSTEFWRDSAGKAPQWREIPRASGRNKRDQIEQSITDSAKKNDWGFIRYAVGNRAHVMGWEHHENGVVFLDPQTGSIADRDLFHPLSSDVRWVILEGTQPTGKIGPLIRGEGGTRES